MPNAPLTASQQAAATYEAALQAIVTNGTAQSAALRAQAQALLKQALALEGPEVQTARQELQAHRQIMQRIGNGP